MPRIAALLIALLFATAPRAEDWPQWRGPDRDGVWHESGILQAIPESGMKVLWRARVGLGWSAPSVAMGKVFVTDRQLRPEVERILCFDQATGKPLWVHTYPCDYHEMEYGNGPRAAPTVHDGKVYTLGARGHLHCSDAAKGEVLWKKDLAAEFDAHVPTYGASAAPLVEGDVLIVVAGGRPDATVMAFDRNTGEVRWKALGDRPAYSSPIAITIGGARQVIVWTGDSVSSLEPSTGKLYWQVPYRATFDEAQAVASPVVHKDMLLCLGAWNRGSLMLKLDDQKPGASVLWKTRSKPTTTISTPYFLDDGHVMVMNGDGSLGCIDAATGDELWNTREPTSRGFGNLHMTPAVDGSQRTFLFNHRGHLILARLTASGYEELGRALLVEPTAGYRAAGPVAWAHPAYAGKCVFARNDRELVCASLAAEQGEVAAAPKQTAKVRLFNDFTGTNAALALAFSPDGALLALGTWRGTVNVIELSTGKALPAPAGHKDFLAAVAFSPNSRFLVSAGGSEFKPARNGSKTSGEVKLWDLAGHEEFGQPTGHTDKVTSAAFSPDSKTLATASADRTVRLWDVASGAERAVLNGHTDAVWSVAFSGSTVVSGGWDRTVRLWDATSGKEIGVLKGHDEEILCVAASPDGRTLASGSVDGTIRLWDLPTRTPRALLKGHGGAVNSLAFSPTGQVLASGSGDETIKLWDVATARERATLRGHRSGISAVAFSPDGRTLASAGLDDAVRLWEVD
jgi:WD40 repeat protein